MKNWGLFQSKKVNISLKFIQYEVSGFFPLVKIVQTLILFECLVSILCEGKFNLSGLQYSQTQWFKKKFLKPRKTECSKCKSLCKHNWVAVKLFKITGLVARKHLAISTYFSSLVLEPCCVCATVLPGSLTHYPPVHPPPTHTLPHSTTWLLCFLYNG